MKDNVTSTLEPSLAEPPKDFMSVRATLLVNLITEPSALGTEILRFVVLAFMRLNLLSNI